MHARCAASFDFMRIIHSFDQFALAMLDHRCRPLCLVARMLPNLGTNLRNRSLPLSFASPIIITSQVGYRFRVAHD